MSDINDYTFAALELDYENKLTREHTKRIFSSALLSAVTEWQSFTIDWITLSIKSDPTEVYELISTKKFGVISGDKGIKLSVPVTRPNKTVPAIKAMLEGQRSGDFRVNWKSDWDAYAPLLAGVYADSVGELSVEDFAFINLTTALRNMVGHQSPSSVKTFNTEMRRPAKGRVKRGVSNPPLSGVDRQQLVRTTEVNGSRGTSGHYLYAKAKLEVPNGFSRTRLGYILFRFDVIAEKLRV